MVKGEWNGVSLWCTVCQHGVKSGIIGGDCPDCIKAGRGYEDYQERPGVLMTPEQASEKHQKEADAIKLMRSKQTSKRYRNDSDVKREAIAEAKAEIMKELNEKYNLVPKVVKTLEAKTGSQSSIETVKKSGSSKPLKGEK